MNKDGGISIIRKLFKKIADVSCHFFFTVEFNQREKKKERKGDGVV